MNEEEKKSLQFNIEAIKSSYVRDGFWPTFPSSTLHVAAPTVQGSKAEPTLEVESIPTPLLLWPEQLAQSVEQNQSRAESALHQKIFDRFHHSGYMVGPGDVYGGDYVVYKGKDPSQTHSVASVFIHDSHIIPVKDILGFGRVNNQVAKSAIIAFENPDKREDIATEDFIVFNFRRVSVRI